MDEVNFIEKLTPTSWLEFETINQRVFGERAPTPDEATVVVERDQDGRIVGTLAVTWLPVVTNAWVQEDRRGTGTLGRMVEKALSLFPDVKCAITFTKDPKVNRLHRLMGLKDEGYASSWRKAE